MSHNIFSNDLTVSSRSAEWHGLAMVHAAKTVDEAVTVFPSIFAPVCTSPITLQGTNDVIPGMLSTYRINPETNQPDILGVVGDGYGLLQNETAMRVFDAAISGKFLEIETFGTLNGGKNFYSCFSFVKGGRASILPSDPLFRVVTLLNSHDGQTSCKVLINTIRVVCQNTWNSSLKSSVGNLFAVRHTRNISATLSDIEAAIDYDEAEWQKGEIAALKRFADIQLTPREAETYIKATLSTRKPLTSADIAAARATLIEQDEAEKKRANFVYNAVSELHETSECSATKGYRGSLYGWYQSALEYLQYESGHDTKQFDRRFYDQIQGENVERTKLAFSNALVLSK